MADQDRSILRARRSLRRGVTLMFVAAVVVTALALALSAYFITRAAQNDEALDKALAQSRFNLLLADSMLPATPQPADFDALLRALQTRGDFFTLIEAGSETYVSGLYDQQMVRGLISDELAARVSQGRIAYQSVKFDDEPTIAVGGQVPSADLTLYFFYPQGARLVDLARLRNILLIAGVALAVLGAIAGYWLSRRMLDPVRAASKAAVRMSQGDLDIRLPTGADEFGVLAASFNRMAENLQTKMLALEAGQARERRFVADVTHELRTPISALVGEASLLKARLDSEPDACPREVKRLAQLIGADIARLRELVDDLLEISKLDAHAAETVMESVNLEGFLSQLLRAHGYANSVRLAPTTTLSVRTDKRRLERILVNLIENALLHGAAPVTIEISPGASSGQLVDVNLAQIAVTDSGPGIDIEHVPHVFDRFYKADPSRSSSRGSGLGLAIARDNARLLGGDLTVANIRGGGARFILTLPVDD